VFDTIRIRCYETESSGLLSEKLGVHHIQRKVKKGKFSEDCIKIFSIFTYVFQIF